MSVEDSGRPSPIGEEVEKKDGVKKGSNTEDGVKKGSNTEDGVKKGSNTKDGVQKGSNTELKKEKGVENVNNNNDEEGEKDKDTVNIQEDDGTVNVLKCRTLVTCLKGLDKQGRPRSDCF